MLIGMWGERPNDLIQKSWGGRGDTNLGGGSGNDKGKLKSTTLKQMCVGMQSETAFSVLYGRAVVTQLW